MAEQEQPQGNIRQESNTATVGLNLDQTLSQVRKGQLTFALNAAVENYDANSINYTNEEGNEFCLSFPEGLILIGKHFIAERNKHIFMLASKDKSVSQIGYMENNDCIYHTLIEASCLNFDIHYPIHKIVHKITNCSTEIYWADGHNPRRYLDIDNIPFKLKYGTVFCDPNYTDEVDCNQLTLQPIFSIPQINIIDVIAGGNNTAGTVQFAVQYSDAVGDPYTSYYSITNPTPIYDPTDVTVNFNTHVGKSVVVKISNLDTTGEFHFFNLAVVKTINDIPSVELVGTYSIEDVSKTITYTGQDVSSVRLSINDIFEKFPFYEIANDVTVVDDVLVWSDLATSERLNCQKIANQISLKWETWRIPPTENYADEINATNFRGYLRDEVYSYEIAFLLNNGKQTDGFHIPGRGKSALEQHSDIQETDPDFIGTPDYYSGGIGYSPYWKIYNTASVTNFSPEYISDPKYKGPYQYGEFSYWESEETYPCDSNVWGDLAGQKIRHHKFPDVLVSPINESKVFISPSTMEMGNNAIFPIGVKIDKNQIKSLISNSSLTKTQKDSIVGFKILRGDRGTNKSIIAKGILRNVGTYKREDQEYYFPNYPYNDLTTDPFLNGSNNAFAQLCNTYDINIKILGANHTAEVQYKDCNTNKINKKVYTEIGSYELCSTEKPTISGDAIGTTGIATYEIWRVSSCALCRGWRVGWDDPIEGYREDWVDGMGGSMHINVIVGTEGPKQVGGDGTSTIEYIELHTPSTSCNQIQSLPSIKETPTLSYRQVFNSPETSFGQPFLGDVLKLESVIYGTGKAHFTEVKKNAKYKLITEEVQRDALRSAEALGLLTHPLDATAMFTAYQAYLTIYVNGITRKNYAYSFNSIADYNYLASIPNGLGVKQRSLDIAKYLIPGVQSVGHKELNINNYSRESSVFLRTDINKTALPFPDETPSLVSGGSSVIKEKSRFTISDINNCSTPGKEEPIQVVSYYASIKNQIVNQWGQIYSYETIDTGFQVIFDTNENPTTVFGGDTFIGRHTFKTKLPFFFDNRVNAPDDSDIFYDEIGNVAYPKYWHSARSILKDYTVTDAGLLSNIIAYKAHNFDCPNTPSDFVTVPYTPPTPGTTTTTSTTTTTTTIYKNGDEISSSTITYYDGYFYLFAYGVPNFYCESSYNMDLRQAFNNREGEYWPHVNTNIPDEWVQESFVPIAQDNTYYYNVTFSKQNKESYFSHLPIEWNINCHTYYPFRAIVSDTQNRDADARVNAWLTYRAASYFDFPQNYGKLISLDGVQNSQVLARFENKSLLYHSMLTINTSNPLSAYMGNPNLFRGTPPLDFADTDLGYVGSQHKFLLKIPQGQITIDAKRGQIFLLDTDAYGRPQAHDLSGFGSGLNRFFTDHLAFEILRYFPEVDIDNAFTSVGLHGVYDSKYDRVIITKLDYIPIDSGIKYDSSLKEFYIDKNIGGALIRTKVELSDRDYFCNKSWTLSYNITTKSWISFHSYLPNWYIAENNFFYSGLNECCDDFDFIVDVLGENPPDCNLQGHLTVIPKIPCLIDVEIPECTTAPEVGDDFQGGKVAYILQESDPGFIEGVVKGFIVTPSDLGTFVKWSKHASYPLPSVSTSISIGEGGNNTQAILLVEGNSGSYAAKLCADYVIDEYNDWVLPSKDELNKIHQNRAVLGLDSETITSYWSSSQGDNSNDAWMQIFNYPGHEGQQQQDAKLFGYFIRAIRYFTIPNPCTTTTTSTTIILE